MVSRMGFTHLDESIEHVDEERTEAEPILLSSIAIELWDVHEDVIVCERLSELMRRE